MCTSKRSRPRCSPVHHCLDSNLSSQVSRVKSVSSTRIQPCPSPSMKFLGKFQFGLHYLNSLIDWGTQMSLPDWWQLQDPGRPVQPAPDEVLAFCLFVVLRFYFIFSVYLGYVHIRVQVPMESRRGDQIPRDWSYRQPYLLTWWN